MSPYRCSMNDSDYEHEKPGKHQGRSLPRERTAPPCESGESDNSVRRRRAPSGTTNPQHRRLPTPPNNCTQAFFLLQAVPRAYLFTPSASCADRCCSIVAPHAGIPWIRTTREGRAPTPWEAHRKNFPRRSSPTLPNGRKSLHRQTAKPNNDLRAQRARLSTQQDSQLVNRA